MFRLNRNERSHWSGNGVHVESELVFMIGRNMHYDLFHVVARYGREVVDRVRVEQANALKSDKPARKVVKSARWLLLRNRAKLSEKQDVKLQELLAANQPLAMVYVLKEALKGIWYAPSVWEGWRRWRSWMRQVKESGLAPLQRFGRNLSKYMRGILASANREFR